MMRFFTTLFSVLFCSVCLAGSPPYALIAHRGASHDAPENTVAAFLLAWEQNADGAECDVYLTKDGHIIACHDKTTKRTTGIEKVVSESTLEELRELDAGSWKDTKFAGEKMPTLAELLATLPEGKVVYVEVKVGPEIVPELIKQLDASKLPAARTPVICFNSSVIAELKKQRPDIPAYFLHDPAKATAEEVIATAKKINADGVDLKGCDELDKTYADKIHAAGLRLDVWTINSPENAQKYIDLGAKGITTDRPAYLRERLQK